MIDSAGLLAVAAIVACWLVIRLTELARLVLTIWIEFSNGVRAQLVENNAMVRFSHPGGSVEIDLGEAKEALEVFEILADRNKTSGKDT